MLSLSIIVYELPFTVLVIRDAFLFVFYERTITWSDFTESMVYKDYDGLTIVPRMFYLT
jgi:hypothetical protein